MQPLPVTISRGLSLSTIVRGVGVVLRKNMHLYVFAMALLLWLYRKLLRDAGLIEQSHSRKLRNKVVHLTDTENQVAACIVDPTNITDTLDQVGGLEHAKSTVKQSVVAPLAAPHLYPPGSLRAPPKGVLLYGPPGTGKTLLARSIAKEANAAFIEVRLDSLLMKYVGESEKNVAAVFSLARKLQPTILFVDEIDGLLCDRDSTSSSSATFNLVKTVFMTEWDGLTTSNETVVVVGATNRPGAIDEAALRRMPVKLKVDFPNAAAREQILRITLAKDPSILPEVVDSLPLSKIAQQCQGYSGSDLHELCKEAALQAVRSANGAFAHDAPLPLKHSHFAAAQTVVGANHNFTRSHTMPRFDEMFGGR
eukprot:TRINITY_DN17843_c0_g1_i1.p1 TRINITY_DN17843_c0_g1~~TRINITY_DN17843_c0_g1_i1.p1  ORF type:complete len:366 (+),score=116.36 TRINITY_DN17843_c0_g1_i1:84-1181(+)